jgi:hypothetical protein
VKLLIRACSWLGCHLLLRTVSHFKLLDGCGVTAKVDQKTILDKDELMVNPQAMSGSSKRSQKSENLTELVLQQVQTCRLHQQAQPLTCKS